MKKAALIFVTIMVMLSVSSTAYAGTLNEYEAEIVEAAKAQYEYNGFKYQVPPNFINQLITYLSRDDVDLTAQQRDQVIQTAFDNIETGVLEGYLVPVQKEQEAETTVPDTADPGKQSDSAASAGNVTTAADSTEHSTASGNDASSELSGTKEQDTGNIAENIVKTATDTDNNPVISSDTGNPTDNSGNAADNTYNPAATLIPSEDNSTTAVVTSDDSNSTNTEINIIKNTGFDFSTTVIILAGLSIMMFAAIYGALKIEDNTHEIE